MIWNHWITWSEVTYLKQHFVKRKERRLQVAKFSLYRIGNMRSVKKLILMIWKVFLKYCIIFHTFGSFLRKWRHQDPKITFFKSTINFGLVLAQCDDMLWNKTLNQKLYYNFILCYLRSSKENQPKWTSWNLGVLSKFRV